MNTYQELTSNRIKIPVIYLQVFLIIQNKIKYTRSGRNGVPKGSNKRKNQLF